jgi:hypothetical protein
MGARRYELVAGGDERDAGAAPDGQNAVAAGCGEANAGGGEALACLDEEAIGGEVAGGGADMLARAGRAFAGKAERRAFARGFLLEEDGVGAFRERRAGENARGFAGGEWVVETGSGGAFADHVPWAGKLGEADGAERSAAGCERRAKMSWAAHRFDAAARDAVS